MASYQDLLETYDNWPASCPVRPEALAAAGLYYSGEADEAVCYVCKQGLCDWKAGDDPYEEHKRIYPDCTLSKQPRPQNVYCDMEEEDKRMQSFTNWPGDVEPSVLVAAGQFYTGQSDITRCYKCQGELNQWKIGDDPFTRHQKDFPDCCLSIQHQIENLEVSDDDSTELNESSSSGTEARTALDCILVTDAVKETFMMCTKCSKTERRMACNKCKSILFCRKCAKKVKQCPRCFDTKE